MTSNFPPRGPNPLQGGGWGPGTPSRFSPGTSALPSTTVELSFSCSNLRNADLFSKSDPFLVVQLRQADRWVEIFRTETIQDTLNPVWQKKLDLEYRFEEKQLMSVSIYDRDSPSNNLQEHDFLGRTECTLGEIVARQSSGFVRELTDGGNGSISIVAEELLNAREEVSFKFRGSNLKKMNWFCGKSDPFLEISRSTESNRYVLVHRTEHIKNTLNPNWKSFKIKTGALCNGDYERDLQFTFYDWERSGDHRPMGSFHTDLRRLSQGPGTSNAYHVNLNGKTQGSIELQEIKIEMVPSFLDYIKGGMEMNFTVAVDFTASNGNPNIPSSLHYRDPSGRPNQYVTAIQSVGEIIQDYDSDNQYPALGFGARIPPDGQVSHEFFLSLGPSPYCSGVDGVLAAYFNSLYNVQLYGPTNFAPVIRHVTRFAHAYMNDPSNYFVLLIITDGIISDLDATKDAIITASELPMSIIIIGVGSEDFGSMDELDSDQHLLTTGARTAKRDIVQFVELQKFVQPGLGSWSKELLAREVLAEIPDQVVQYMRSRGFKPATPRPTHQAATAPSI